MTTSAGIDVGSGAVKVVIMETDTGADAKVLAQGIGASAPP